MPAYSCYDLATAADGADVKVRLYDLDPSTLRPDVDSLRRITREGVCAIVIVHLFGIPVPFEEIEEVARTDDVPIIEDAAQGFGASHRGAPLGSLGALAILSFGRGKGITGGRGGALLANADHAKAALDALPPLDSGPRGAKELLLLAALWAFGRPGLYGIPASLPLLGLGETRYRESRPPAGLSAVSAAVLKDVWSRSRDEGEARRRNAHRLLGAVDDPDCGVTAIGPPPGAQAGYLRLPFLASPRVRRGLVNAASRRLGIMPGYPEVLGALAGFKERVVGSPREWVGARALATSLCTLPTHSRLTARDMEAIRGHVHAVAGRRPSAL
jgi:dTDP-4-amino-4,6-dideoxygalactose transaminase